MLTESGSSVCKYEVQDWREKAGKTQHHDSGEKDTDKRGAWISTQTDCKGEKGKKRTSGHAFQSGLFVFSSSTREVCKVMHASRRRRYPILPRPAIGLMFTISKLVTPIPRVSALPATRAHGPFGAGGRGGAFALASHPSSSATTTTPPVSPGGLLVLTTLHWTRRCLFSFLFLFFWNIWTRPGQQLLFFKMRALWAL